MLLRQQLKIQSKNLCQSNLGSLFIELINILISSMDLSHSFCLTTNHKVANVHYMIYLNDVLYVNVESIKYFNHAINYEKALMIYLYSLTKA